MTDLLIKINKWGNDPWSMVDFADHYKYHVLGEELAREENRGDNDNRGTGFQSHLLYGAQARNINRYL